MTSDQINYLNILLIILSGCMAVILPFELFLFSYIILGPLHYLTELSWLHKRKYFVPNRNDAWLLAGLACLILLPTAVKLAVPSFFHDAKSTASGLLQQATCLARMLVFVAFAGAAILLLVPGLLKRSLAFAVVLLIAMLFQSQYFITIVFAIFVPTLIHVFLFTGAFMLTGAMKNNDGSGLAAFLVFLAVPLVIVLLPLQLFTVPAGIVTTVYNAQFVNLNDRCLPWYFIESPLLTMYFSLVPV